MKWDLVRVDGKRPTRTLGKKEMSERKKRRTLPKNVPKASHQVDAKRGGALITDSMVTKPLLAKRRGNKENATAVFGPKMDCKENGEKRDQSPRKGEKKRKETPKRIPSSNAAVKCQVQV